MEMECTIEKEPIVPRVLWDLKEANTERVEESDSSNDSSSFIEESTKESEKEEENQVERRITYKGEVLKPKMDFSSSMEMIQTFGLAGSINTSSTITLRVILRCPISLRERYINSDNE